MRAQYQRVWRLSGSISVAAVIMTKRLVGQWLVLACFVFLLQKTGASRACATVHSIGQSALLGHVYKTTSGTQLISCSAACSEDKRCYSFNFILPTETCELNEAARSAVNARFFVRRPSSLYFDKLQTVPLPNSCARSPCKNGATCREVARQPGFECRCLVGHTGHHCEVCSLPSALGMEDGRIDSHSISASSYHEQHVPNNSRLHSHSSWAANKSDPSTFLQISFHPKFKLITGVATQGDPRELWFVMRYRLWYSDDGRNWNVYGPKLGQRWEFGGNVNGREVMRQNVISPFKARFVRFDPTHWRGRIALRVELYGCDAN